MSDISNKKIIIIIVAAMLAITIPLGFFLFKDGSGNPTEPNMQVTTTNPTTNGSTTTNPTTTNPTTTPPTTDNTTVPPTTVTPPTTVKPTEPEKFDPNGTFVIAKNGKKNAKIVLSANASAKEKAAANDLIDYLNRMTGAGFSAADIVNDGDTLPTDQFYICVGGTKYGAKLGVQKPTGYPQNEKLIVKRVQNFLILVGNDDAVFTGTEFAVTRFLEEMGCGWFGNGNLWTVVPEKATLSFKNLNIVETPKFINRSNRLLTTGSTKDLAKRWYMGGVEVLAGQHFMMAWVGNSHQTAHPEWYAKNANGTQMYPLGNTSKWPDGYWQFCYSNSGLHDFVAQRVAEYFAIHPNCMVFTITPNDGFKFGTCQCAGCKAFANDTDLIINFANEVAKRTAKTYPDRQVSFLTYHTTLTAPSTFKIVEPNVEIMFCTETSMTKPTSTVGYIGMSYAKQNIPWKTNFLNYIARTEVQHRAIWKWLCIAAESAKWQNVPWVQGDVAIDDQNFWKENGVKYVFYDQGPLNGYREFENSIPLRWPLWYVANKGCWDQDASGEDLLREACKKLYGKGADAMLQYYLALAEASESTNADSHAWWAPEPNKIYTPTHVKNIDSKIDAAKKMLSKVSETEKKRMENQIKLWEKAKTYL